MKRRNTLTLMLMASSIALLLLLQFFWLRGAYEDAAENFRKETSSLFRNTIFAMHDSLIQKSIMPASGADSMFTFRRQGLHRFRFRDSVTFTRKTDSVFGYDTEKTAQIEIITSSEKADSLGSMLRPFVTNLRYDGEPKTFILRMVADTLKTDSIRYYFSQALEEAGISTSYKVLKMKMNGGRKTQGGWRLGFPGKEFTSEWVPLTPMTHYAAEFEAVPSFLVRKITPQIFFSIFLTLLTMISFYMMVRNLREQQRLMEIKNDFISNVTHELKTPVATVSVALEALKNFNVLHDPQKTREYLDIAQSELNRLTLMTDKILKTSVYEDQGVNLKYEILNIDQVVDQVLSSMKLVFDKKQTQLRFEKVGSDFVIEGSHEHLTNVLYNLVDNALKYSGENSRLVITLESQPEKIILNVKDSGIGIAKEYQDKIFEKFFRVPSGDVHNNKGYGLGLSYVASVIESHKGEISVESEQGQGSNFKIVLPRKRK